MAKILAVMGLWGPRVLGLLGIVGSSYESYHNGMSVQNVIMFFVSAAVSLAKGWNVTGGTVPNTVAAPGTLPESMKGPATTITKATVIK